MSPRLRRWIMFALLLLMLLSLVVEAVQAQDATATPEGSVAQLSLGYEPTLGLKLMIPDLQLKFFSASGYGGGQVYVSVGNPCVSGYTNMVSSLGTVWVDANSVPVDIRFESTQPGANAGIYMYDMMNNQWYCTDQFASTATLHWESVPKGVYFLWILTEQPGAISGNLTINGSQTTVQPTAQPTRGR